MTRKKTLSPADQIASLQNSIANLTRRIAEIDENADRRSWSMGPHGRYMGAYLCGASSMQAAMENRGHVAGVEWIEQEFDMLASLDANPTACERGAKWSVTETLTRIRRVSALELPRCRNGHDAMRKVMAAMYECSPREIGNADMANVIGLFEDEEIDRDSVLHLLDESFAAGFIGGVGDAEWPEEYQPDDEDDLEEAVG